MRGKGITLVPLSIFTKGSLVKVEVGLVRGMKAHEKKDKLKKRDIQREVERTLRDREVGRKRNQRN